MNKTRKSIQELDEKSNKSDKKFRKKFEILKKPEIVGMKNNIAN
jgi:hypothetical protein